MRLKDKVVIITGAAGGIGAAAAELFAEQGAKVIATDAVEARFAPDSGIETRILNVTDEAQWRDVASSVKQRFGRIDGLVNAAGIEGKLDDATPLCSLTEWRRVMSVNLDGTFLGVGAVMPTMMEQKTGSIVNLASLVTYIATPFSTPYGASKAAVWHYSRSAAAFGALEGRRIRCNSVHPGLIKSQMTDTILGAVSARTGVSVEAAEKATLRSVPFGERGVPLDVANLLLYLISDESAYVTGSEFKVDGGWSLGQFRAG